jgi:chemotaxis signal transduction protein
MLKLQNRSVKPIDSLKVLVAPLRNLHLALPLTTVQKVIRMPAVFHSGNPWLGVSPIADRGIIILDLHQMLYGCPNPEPEQHLVLLQSRDGRSFGIPTVSVPTVLSVPTTAIQPLPADYRDRDALGIASHFIAIDQAELPQTLFLLDVARIFERAPAQ